MLRRLSRGASRRRQLGGRRRRRHRPSTGSTSTARCPRSRACFGPGGTFGVIVNLRDESVPWVAELGAHAPRRGRHRLLARGRRAGQLRAALRRRSSRPTFRTCRDGRRGLVGLAATRSYALTLPAAEREALLAEVEALGEAGGGATRGGGCAPLRHRLPTGTPRSDSLASARARRGQDRDRRRRHRRLQPRLPPDAPRRDGRRAARAARAHERHHLARGRSVHAVHRELQPRHACCGAASSSTARSTSPTTRPAPCASRPRADRVDEFRHVKGVADQVGVPFEIVPPERAAELFPLLDPDGLLAAAYLPTDGWIDPATVANALAGERRARARGSCAARP